jgi:hypothetical protein
MSVLRNLWDVLGYLWEERLEVVKRLFEFTFYVLFIVAVHNEDATIDLIKKLYLFLSFFLSQFWINLIGVILIGALGALLYLFRKKKRTWYGIVEVSFALAYGWNAINKVTKVGYVETISVVASIYLVVRGVDNYIKGREAAAATRSERYSRIFGLHRLRPPPEL